ncbi:hypothetical protein F511_42368 [Dorcoceras hygrometricum]|uniref:Uncharacterized protein n=1 Tax=Dorcoceras hygrometricum TaxID=472368 RepID=A0A2Z7AG81_9LAMI|nr:hypothetical protein F511_42368 [Dorcoceras hygrometricum]
MMFRVVRTNQYNQDLGLIHSTNGNHLESPKEGSSIDHQVTIYLHAQNITMFPTNETWRRPKLNQLEHNNLADDEDQLQALKSKVNQLQELQLKIQQMSRGASFGMSCDDISLDVITISRWSQAQKLKRRRVLNQQMKRKRSIQSLGKPVASYSVQSQALHIQSTWCSGARREEAKRLKKISSEAVDILRRDIIAGCQLLSSIQNGESDSSLQKKRTQVLLLYRGALHQNRKKTRQPSGALKSFGSFPTGRYLQRLYIVGDAL